MSTPKPAAQVGIKSLLIAYDFSDASRKPLHYALVMARYFGAKLHIAYVVPSVGYGIAGPQALQLAAEGCQRDVRQLESDLLKSGALAGIQYEFLLREGNVWEQLESLIQQEQIDAIVVGTHAREGLGRLVLGSVAEQVFRQANCLVVTIGPGAQELSVIERKEPHRPFLFATDFSAGSLHALPHAASFANQFGTKLMVLHVLPAAPIPETFHWSTAGDLKQMREEAQSAIQKQFEELVAPHVPPATKLEFLVKFGMPVEQILQACHELKADLLVLGVHAALHAATASHLPWVRAHEIVCGAHCSVLTIKGPRPTS